TSDSARRKKSCAGILLCTLQICPSISTRACRLRFVRRCRYWAPRTRKACLVRAEVMPSQAAAGKGHDAWVCVDNLSRHVLAAHCQCKAG
ncbi:hypothetical protein V5799_015977, partial [Amblyomma americanum]